MATETTHVLNYSVKRQIGQKQNENTQEWIICMICEVIKHVKSNYVINTLQTAADQINILILILHLLSITIVEGKCIFVPTI